MQAVHEKVESSLLELPFAIHDSDSVAQETMRIEQTSYQARHARKPQHGGRGSRSEEFMACLGHKTLSPPRPDINKIGSVRWLRRGRRELTTTHTTR